MQGFGLLLCLCPFDTRAPRIHTPAHACCVPCLLPGKISRTGDVGTAPGLFKCSCTDQKEKEQTDRRGSKLGEDGKRIVLKEKAESLASLPTLTPLHSQHLPSDNLHQSLLKGKLRISA